MNLEARIPGHAFMVGVCLVCSARSFSRAHQELLLLSSVPVIVAVVIAMAAILTELSLRQVVSQSHIVHDITPHSAAFRHWVRVINVLCRLWYDAAGPSIVSIHFVKGVEACSKPDCGAHLVMKTARATITSEEAGIVEWL